MHRSKTQHILLNKIRRWFGSHGWQPWEFQEQTWEAYLNGEQGLVNVATGNGKTYAAYFGPLVELIDDPQDQLTIIYVTPLRAVARDIALALQAPLDDLGLEFALESRTGDSSSSQKARQRKKMPHILITTPESLALLLSYSNADETFGKVRCVILDEWHELMSSKRGTLLELTMTRLRQFAPQTKTWALSATIANLNEAAQVAVGCDVTPRIIRSHVSRHVTIDSLIPESIDAFPWAGHLGISMLPRLLAVLDPEVSTLIFTNTRSHAERWYQSLLHSRPEWADKMALHHGSLDLEERETIEAGLKNGTLTIVVCTSSLDLGVDFGPVERVFQIGSPKGVARLLQRAGRSAHRPGATSQITFVPTSALELVEIAAARNAVALGQVEGRDVLQKPLDVLTQHIVTCALGSGFDADELFASVCRAVSFRNLTRLEFDWVLALVLHGGDTLQAYPDYHRVDVENARYTVSKPRIARLHRMNIGTILSDATIKIRFLRGGSLGRVEESYIARLRPGDKFVFAGRALEFIKVRDMEAYVRPAKGKVSQTPRWYGGKLPFSPSLASAVRDVLEGINDQTEVMVSELRAVKPILAEQQRLSRLPNSYELLAEICHTREGSHLFLYPFEGRGVHEGLAVVLALRLSRLKKATFSISVNDYGLELLCADPFPFADLLSKDLLSPHHLLQDTIDAVNVSELAKRQFREIARIAGLVFQSFPGMRKGSHQIQASASLLFDVFARFDPDNLLLKQAGREVLEHHFEETRLAKTMQRLVDSDLVVTKPEHVTPLGFPLLIERLGAKVSSESMAERVEKIKSQWVQPNSRSPSEARPSSL